MLVPLKKKSHIILMVILSTIADNYQGNLSVIPGMNFLSLTQAERNDPGSTFEPRKHLDFLSWDELSGNFTPGSEPLPASPLFPSAELQTPETTSKQGDDKLGLLLAYSLDKKQEHGILSSVQEQTRVCNDITMTVLLIFGTWSSIPFYL